MAMGTKIRWMLQDALSKRGIAQDKLDEDAKAARDIEERKMAEIEANGAMARSGEQARRVNEADDRYSKAVDVLQQNSDAFEVTKNRMSPDLYALQHGGGALALQGTASGRSGSALGQPAVKPGDTLDANVDALKMVNDNYNKMRDAVAINPAAATPDMLDPQTGKLWARDKYVKNNYAATQALIGAGGQSTEERLAAARDQANFRDAAEVLNARENTMISRVGENGAPVGASDKGFMKFTLGGVNDTGMPVANPSVPPPEGSVVRQGLSPKSNAVKTTSGNTTDVVPVKQSTPAEAVESSVVSSKPYSVPGLIKKGINAVPTMARNASDHWLKPAAQALSQTYFGDPNPALLDRLAGSKIGNSVRKNLLMGGSAETSDLTSGAALRRRRKRK